MRFKKINLLALIFISGCNYSATKSNDHDEDKKLYIDSRLIQCVDVSPMKCMRVKHTINGEWESFHGRIEGFDYKEGYTYQIKVKAIEIKNPPTDHPNLKYKLISIINKKTEGAR